MCASLYTHINFFDTNNSSFDFGIDDDTWTSSGFARLHGTLYIISEWWYVWC